QPSDPVEAARRKQHRRQGDADDARIDAGVRGGLPDEDHLLRRPQLRRRLRDRRPGCLERRIQQPPFGLPEERRVPALDALLTCWRGAVGMRGRVWLAIASATAAVALLAPAPAAVADPVLAAAGDIACPPGVEETATACHQAETAALVAAINPDAVALLGDNQ